MDLGKGLRSDGRDISRKRKHAIRSFSCQFLGFLDSQTQQQRVPLAPRHWTVGRDIEPSPSLLQGARQDIQPSCHNSGLGNRRNCSYQQTEPSPVPGETCPASMFRAGPTSGLRAPTGTCDLGHAPEIMICANDASFFLLMTYFSQNNTALAEVSRNFRLCLIRFMGKIHVFGILRIRMKDRIKVCRQSSLDGNADWPRTNKRAHRKC